MESIYSIKNFVMSGGKQYCLLINRLTGLQLYNPNLYIANKLRNRLLSVSGMKAALSGIAVLLLYMADQVEDLGSPFNR